MIRKILNRYPFVKFLLVGGINTIFGYLVYVFFVYLISNPYLALLLATIVAVLFNFKTYGSIVFRSSDHTLLYRFFGVYLSMMLLQMAFLKILMLSGIENKYAAGGILTLPMAALSFFLMRKFVFQPKPPSQG